MALTDQQAALAGLFDEGGAGVEDFESVAVGGAACGSVVDEGRAMEACLDYFGGEEIAARVWLEKYALRDGEGRLLEGSPEAMHMRIARELARIERGYGGGVGEEDWMEVLRGFRRVVPQGSPMAGIGNPFRRTSLSNCVVVASPRDTMSGIFETGKELANLFKRRAGVGLSLDTLRPEGARVGNAARSSTGAWSFAEFYSSVTRLVGQAGRRGALMVTMDVRHPDVPQFVAIKQDLSQATGANLSVMVGDAFMRAALAGESWVCHWPVSASAEEVAGFLERGGAWSRVEGRGPLDYEKWEASDGSEAMVLHRHDAGALWRFITECARNTAEPGVLFWDTYRRELPADCYEEFRSVSTNPCSEIALSPYDSCRLVSVNLTGYVRGAHAAGAWFDFQGFGRDVRLAVRMLDDIVDLELEAIGGILERVDEQGERGMWERMAESARRGRRVGLGTHGLGDALAGLGVAYGSVESLEVVERVYGALRDAAYGASVELAQERGAFPAYDAAVEEGHGFLGRLPEQVREEMQRVGRRNISLLTNAPTGSVSILSQTSSGIEPPFRHLYLRRKKVADGDLNARVDFVDGKGDRWEEFEVLSRSVREYFGLHQEAEAAWVAGRGSKREVGAWSAALDSALPAWFVHAGRVSAEDRVRVQGVLQRAIDHGVSSTINLPETVSAAEVRSIYEQAWREGLKGVTVYRDNCRTGVLLTGPGSGVGSGRVVEHDAPARPERLECDIHRVTVDGEGWTICVGLLDGRPYEVFAGLSRTVEVPRRWSKGEIVKVRLSRRADARPARRGGSKGASRYDLVVGDADDPLVVRDIAVAFGDEETGWATRLLSTSLRHGVPLKFIVQQLRRAGGASLGALNRVMARVLAGYVVDEETGERQGECLSGNCD